MTAGTRLPDRDWIFFSPHLDDALWATKLDAVRAYRSQLPPTASLWPDEAAMLHDLRGRREPEHDAPAVEWLWRRPSGRPSISRD